MLVLEKETAAYFEEVARGRDPKLAANWVMGDLFAALNRTKRGIDDPPVSGRDLGALLDLMKDGTLPASSPRRCSRRWSRRAARPAPSSRSAGLKQVTDTGAIEALLDELIAANAGKVASGAEEKVVGWFVGQVMKATAGKANPGLVNQLVITKLGLG